MTLSFIVRSRRLVATAVLLATAIVLSGCPYFEEKPAKQPAEKQGAASAPAAQPANSLLKEGTGSEPSSESAAKNNAREVPVPLLQQAAKSEQPIAAEVPPKAEPKPEPAKEEGLSLEKPAAKDEKPDAAAVPMPQTPEDETFEQAEKLRDLGDPMVENADKLVRLDPKQPVWVDRENKQVVLMGEVCTAGYPLEFFATYPNRSYEAVVSVNVKPSIAHAGLLAVGAKPGRPVQFQPEFVPPSGTEIAIEIRWKDADGKAQSADAKQWVRNIRTRKALETNWVFAGSMFIKDEDGKLHYQAESGELICVLNLSTAMLDLPMRSVSALEERAFEAFAEHLPPEGTVITLLLKPILDGKPAEKADKPADEAK